MQKSKPGDHVKITTKEASYKGILMPTPELLDTNVTIIKLSTGYNIGIDNDKIKAIDIIERYKKPEPCKEKKLKQNPKLPDVTILSTGGTISSKIDYRTGGVYADYTAEDFIRMIPKLAGIANIKPKKMMSVMSEDMIPDSWSIMAKEIAHALNSGSRGVVITQGTDTMHFTCAALSFMLQNLNHPVIITASQRSIDRGSSDAFMNLEYSVKAAASFDLAGVATCMHGSDNDDYCLLIRGTKVRKMHTSRRDAFRPINDLPIAKVSSKGFSVINKSYKKIDKDKQEVRALTKFEKKTALIYAYPGLDPEIIDYYLDKGYKGIVIAATALGHVNTNDKKYSLIKAIERAHEMKVPVVITSQTLYGAVHPYVYSNLRKLSIKAGCIFAKDMLPETAYVKLGWVLGHTSGYDEAKAQMLRNIAGEFSGHLDHESFLY